MPATSPGKRPTPDDEHSESLQPLKPPLRNRIGRSSHQRENIGLLAYSPLAFGVLSGKYLQASPKDGRITLFPRFSRYSNTQAQEATKRYVQLARDHGYSPAQMALAFVNQQPFLTSNIIGATTMPQLQENIASAQISLTEEVLQEIEAIAETIPNPSP
jgi:aryl-alcohol dehydrogenase-like predicted oxidoreductase